MCEVCLFLQLLVFIKVSICTNVVFLIVHTLCLSLPTCSPRPEVICLLKRMSTCLKYQNHGLCLSPPPSLPLHPADFVFLSPSQGNCQLAQTHYAWNLESVLSHKSWAPRKLEQILNIQESWSGRPFTPQNYASYRQGPVAMPSKMDTLDIIELVSTKLMELL